MKIALLKGSLSGHGGLEKYCVKIAEALALRGDEVQILGFGKMSDGLKYRSVNGVNDHLNTPSSGKDSGSQSVVSPISVHRICSKYSSSLLQLILFNWACSRYMRKKRPDVVFGFFRNRCPQKYYRAGNGCHKAYLERRKGTDSIWKRISFSFNPLHRYILRCEKETYESPDLKYLIVNSHLVRREIEHYYPSVDPKKIHVIHNGVEWKSWESYFQRSFHEYAEICRSLNLDVSTCKILFIGHEWKRKGLGLLMQAISALHETNGLNHIELLVVGHDRHDALFKRMALDLNICEKVHFYGRQADVWKFYAISDICVIPSTYDPFANVTVEALAMGCFVISSSENGGSEVIAADDKSGAKNGLVFSNLDSPDELQGCILTALDFIEHVPRGTPSDTRVEKLVAIRKSVEHLDFSRQLERVLDLITIN